jgi:hypothetical protein
MDIASSFPDGQLTISTDSIFTWAIRGSDLFIEDAVELFSVIGLSPSVF